MLYVLAEGTAVVSSDGLVVEDSYAVPDANPYPLQTVGYLVEYTD